MESLTSVWNGVQKCAVVDCHREWWVAMWDGGTLCRIVKWLVYKTWGTLCLSGRPDSLPL